MAVRRPAAKKPQEEASGLPQGDDRLLVEAAKKDPSRFAELYELNFAPGVCLHREARRRSGCGAGPDLGRLPQGAGQYSQF